MDSKREPYRRLKIKESEFRLLVLQPGSWGHELVCDLKIASHPKDEHFEALSYTWGTAGDLRPITVNHECIGITTNLEIALRYLRKPDEPRVLWVDALCIDQEDTGEKSSQVQRIGEIFSSANSILAWLGPPEPKSEEAMQAIEKIGIALLPIHCADGGLAYCRGLSPADLQKNMGLQLSAMNWDAIWAICERPYWHRVWIIQELFLSADIFKNVSENRCLVGCGSVWTPLPAFSGFVFMFGIVRANPQWTRYISLPPLSILSLHGAPPVEEMFTILWTLSGTLIVHDGSRVKRSISQLQRMSRKFQATDARDKLYAFLELAEDHLVTPDYTLSVSEVYSNWTKSCIAQDKTLYCLHGNRDLSNSFGPSWVPEIYSEVVDGHAFECVLLGDQSGRLSASVTFIEGGSVLKARGLSLGSLDRVVGPFEAGSHRSSTDEENNQTKITALLADKFLELINFYLSLPKDLQNSAWRAFILDMDTSYRAKPKSPAPDNFYHLWRALIAFSLEVLPDKTLFDETTSSRTYPDFFLELLLLIADQLTGFMSPFAESMSNALYSDRCFFITDGLRVGVGPKCTKPGDEVVLLFGSPLCFVLRPEGERYRLIGDAYVQDVPPELWSNDHNALDVTVKDFEIQ